MDNGWEKLLNKNIEEFLLSLKGNFNSFKFSPVLEGATKAGEELSLGFSCYVLKCYYMLGLWEKLDSETQSDWIDYLNSFQKNIKEVPNNSFVDLPMYNFYNSPKRKYAFKNLIKIVLNNLKILKRRTSSDLFMDSIRAESKQTISTLYQLGFRNNKKYSNFPQTEEEICSYLDSFNWEEPWNAGAQFSALCVFTSTQLDSPKKERNELILYKYLDKVLENSSGFYHRGIEVGQKEKINGAMKIITGLDWINKPIHHPQKIIDYCLEVVPESDGCDIVDIIYVLYKCTNQSNYKKNEVVEYLNKLKKIIRKNYHPEYGAFSYFSGKSQTHYYGLKISKGFNTPDIHGTTLLLWALTMIYNLNGNTEFKVIKP